MKHLHAGDIGTVAKLGSTGTGDTLCDKAQRADPAHRPSIRRPCTRSRCSPRPRPTRPRWAPHCTRLAEEDPTLSWHQEASTNQTILQGMGDQHIDVAIRKAEAKFQVGLMTETPRVPYRETVTRTGNAMHRHKKQTGGAGPVRRGPHAGRAARRRRTSSSSTRCSAGAISHSFMPAIEKGVRAVLKAGVLAGYPVENVRAVVTDGKEHPVELEGRGVRDRRPRGVQDRLPRRRPGAARTDHERARSPCPRRAWATCWGI